MCLPVIRAVCFLSIRPSVPWFGTEGFSTITRIGVNRMGGRTKENRRNAADHVSIHKSIEKRGRTECEDTETDLRQAPQALFGKSVTPQGLHAHPSIGGALAQN